MPEERMKRTEAAPSTVAAYLHAIEYPCSKSDLVNYAASHGAPQMTIDALQRMPEEQYYDFSQVMDRFGKVNP